MNYKRSKTWWRATLITALLICFFAAGQSLPAERSTGFGDFFPGDFLEYWASARLLLDGKNPYSPEEQLALRHIKGRLRLAQRLPVQPRRILVRRIAHRGVITINV